MLNINDFKEKQLLFIQSENCGEGLRFRNENLVLERNRKIVNQLSCHKILAVFVMGNTTITSNFIKQSMSFGISIFLTNKNFFLYASLEPKAEGNYLLRQKQYFSLAENDFLMAKKIVKNKVYNQLKLLDSVELLDDFQKRKEFTFEKIDAAKTVKELLGIEGEVSRRFFGLYFQKIGWYRRLPRAKQDEINLLLDIGYSFLFNYIDCLLRLHGFDVYRGFYHKFFFKRKSLSCDIMEPFRCLIDRAIFKMYSLKVFDSKDFEYHQNQYNLSWKKSKKYSQFFLKEIVKYKMDIFEYVLGFYQTTMDDKKDFPEFNPRFK